MRARLGAILITRFIGAGAIQEWDCLIHREGVANLLLTISRCLHIALRDKLLGGIKARREALGDLKSCVGDRVGLMPYPKPPPPPTPPLPPPPAPLPSTTYRRPQAPGPPRRPTLHLLTILQINTTWLLRLFSKNILRSNLPTLRRKSSMSRRSQRTGVLTYPVWPNSGFP